MDIATATMEYEVLPEGVALVEFSQAHEQAHGQTHGQNPFGRARNA